MKENIKTKKPIFWGVGSGLLLLAFYFLVLTLANSFSHALDQFQIFDFWLLVLAGGFGLQVGLYSYIRQKIRQNRWLKTAKKEVAATGSITTGSMIACCAHHLVDVLPILGFSAAFLFLARYQLFFLIFGIVSNIIGVIFMLEIIKKHSLYKKDSFLSQISQFNIPALKKLAIIGSALLLLITFFFIKKENLGNSPRNTTKGVAEKVEIPLENSKDEKTEVLPSVVKEAGGLSIEAQPIDFSLSKPLQFKISLNTHQGDLAFDLSEKSVLIDEKNNQYLPLEWNGAQGGHHLSGTLTFPVIEETKKIKLIISNVYGVKEREFLWELE